MMRRDQTSVRKKPSLVDLCVQKAIDNVRYLGNVGPVDHHLLERILPHCTLDQLMHVEKASKVRRVFLLFVLTVDKVRTRLK
jgi:elongin-A